MALGGGIWQTQNKVLPGTYVNFSSITRASAALSDRGYAAAPFVLSWGPENEVFAVTGHQFRKNSKAIFGYSYDHPKLWAVREIFLHATTVYCYRLGAGAVKASNDFAQARYPGRRGNDITIVIAPDVDDDALWNVTTCLDGAAQDTQIVAGAAELTGNDWVDFKRDAVLEASAGTPLTGGTDAEEITGESHQAFLDRIESWSFNVLCCPAAEETVTRLYAAFTRRLRDEAGAKFQLVAWRPEADDEGVIGVWNEAAHPDIEGVQRQCAVYWTAGAQAGAAVNRSLANTRYDGELILDTQLTQAQLAAGLEAGRFLFHSVSGETRVLEDINTLRTLSDTRGEVFRSNQTMRVCDQIANDIAVLFGQRYVGQVPNDASGRSALWGDITGCIGQLEKLRAVENFDPDTVTCEQGDSKKAVLVTISGLNVISAMSQLYMSVVVQ